MNITERFSIEDFLAYFFPGVLGTLGLFLLLLLSPLQELFTHINKDLEAFLISGVCSDQWAAAPVI